MKIRKLAILVLSLIMAITLVACGQDTPPASAGQSGGTPSESAPVEPAEKQTIGFCVADADDQWLSYLYDEAHKFATEHPEYDFIFSDAKNDLAEQLAVVENMIIQGADAIVVNPYDSEATGPIVDMCKESGIYAISVNRPFANQEKADCGCYGDSKQSGVLEMEYLAKHLDYKGKIAIFTGGENQEAAIKRTEGFMEVIDKYDGLEVVFKQTGNWNRDEGMALMEDLLSSGIEVDAIASNNDEMAIGAYIVLQDAGNKDIIVGGIDASPDALQYLAKDSQYVVTVFQDAHGQAYGALGAAVSLLKGESVEKEILIDYELVTPDLTSKYLEIWGVK
ncbi:MAG TPA: hypothetical protein DD738_00145 [Ruminiclostridium sp.]|nr:hypothetical protein [Ruminiclostridium sp.]